MPNPTQPRSQPLDFKGLDDWIEVFRAGSHTDSKGVACTFNTADLDQMVANVSLGKPPAVIGHPKHNDPAYAWGTLKREGESLFAKFEDVNPAFESGVKSGAYRNRSVSILKDPAAGWRVRHIGWLGAAPPAIDGLQSLDLSAAAGESHEFAAGDDMTMSWALSDVASVLRGLRDWVISKDGLDAANSALPDWTITSINNAATRLREQTLADPALFTAQPHQPGASSMSLTQEDLNRTAAETEARVRTELQAQFNAQTEELRTIRTERQTERIKAQIAGWKTAHLVTAAEEAGLAEFMASLENANAGEFQFTAAGESAPAKTTPAAWFAEFMAARKPVIPTTPSADNRTDPGASGDTGGLTNREIADRAHAFQAKQQAAGVFISTSAAIDAVVAGKDKA